jgi:hypothetical protein
MRARRPLGLATILVLAMLWPTQASAGGYDALHFRRDHYLVGEVAATTDVFLAGELEDAGPLDGRAYYAYLLPQSATQSGFGMIDAPTIPEGSILLGALQVSAPFEPKGYSGTYARASLTFTVPDVPTGDYAIGFCDDPCEHGFVGWLAWGSIRIVHTEREGEMLANLDRQQVEEWRLRQDLRRSVRDAEDLAIELGEAKAALRLERLDATTPSERVVAVPTAAEDDGAGFAWWQTLLGAAIGLGAGLWLGRRRRVRDTFVVPDTVPEDLDRLESVG